MSTPLRPASTNPRDLADISGADRSGRGARDLDRTATRESRHTRALWATLAALTVLLVPGLASADDKTAFDVALALGPILGPIAAGGVAFAFGLLTCVTPCVFPMITITVSIFGAREAKSRRQAMMLSTCFVLGIVALFTPLFVGAALSGKIFGSMLANAWVVGFIALVFVALALSMFGLFELALPDSLQQRLSTVGGSGYGGAFLLGLVSSLIAAPCVGPVASSILLFIQSTRDIALGALFGSAYALGLGVPFWLVGTFAVSLPKGGKWMLWVKSFFGIVMIVMALYFLKAPFPVLAALVQPTTIFLVLMAGVAIAGLAIGAVHLDWHDGGASVRARKVAGVVASVVGAFFFLAALEKPAEAPPVAAATDGKAPLQLLSWEHSEVDAVAKARAEKRPMIVDFTADWCGACKKLAKETLAHPSVMEKASNFVAVKIDATNDDDPQVEAVKGKYNVVALPTLVIYDSTGAERKRFKDFVGPDEFLAAIAGVN